MLSRRLLIIILFLLFFNVACESPQMAEGIPGKLKRVVSGQTIEVFIEDQIYQLRLTGLNAPPLSQKPWGENAKQFLIDTLTSNSASPLLLIETDLKVKDRFGRLQGYIWSEQQLINQKIVEEGCAIVNLTYTDGKYDQKLLNAQNYARIMGKGIWNPQQPLKQLNSSSQLSSQ